VDVKQAAKVALAYVADLYADERLSDLGLEEVDFDNSTSQWLITVGFSRPWDRATGSMAALAGQQPSRSYKVLRIDENGTVRSLKDRKL
jgi:hypothetical protein